MSQAYSAIYNRAVTKIEKPGLNKKNKSRQKSQAEKDHLNWVASQPCMIPGCKNQPCVHHIRLNGEPRDHFKTLPLCPDHHQYGPEALHQIGKKRWWPKYGHEMDMLDELMKRKETAQ